MNFDNNTLVSNFHNLNIPLTGQGIRKSTSSDIKISNYSCSVNTSESNHLNKVNSTSSYSQTDVNEQLCVSLRNIIDIMKTKSHILSEIEKENSEVTNINVVDSTKFTTYRSVSTNTELKHPESYEEVNNNFNLVDNVTFSHKIKVNSPSVNKGTQTIKSVRFNRISNDYSIYYDNVLHINGLPKQFMETVHPRPEPIGKPNTSEYSQKNIFYHNIYNQLTTEFDSDNYKLQNGCQRLGSIKCGTYRSHNNRFTHDSNSNFNKTRTNYKQRINNNKSFSKPLTGHVLNTIKIKPKSSSFVNMQLNSTCNQEVSCKINPTKYFNNFPQLEISKYGEIKNNNTVSCCIINNSDSSVELHPNQEYCDILLEDIHFDDNPRLPKDWLNSSSQVNENPELSKLLTDYKNIINKNQPTITLPEVDIETQPHSIPCHANPYRVSEHKQKIIDEQIEEWLRKGIVSHSNSQWSSPVVLVSKKLPDGQFKHRVCGDYKNLNTKVIRKNFALPIPEKLLNRVRGARFFSKIDLEAAYLQLPLSERSKNKTAIITENHFVHFNYLSYGISIASQTMQRTMHSLFRSEIHKFLEIFQDDLCLYSKTYKEHIRHLKIVLQKLADAGLIINLKKCNFIQRSINYLGMDIDGTSIKISDHNTEVIRNWPYPSNTKNLKYVLGHSGYYRNFVQGYSERTRNLRNLVNSKSKFKLEEIHKKEFDDIKSVLSSPPILSLFNPSLPTVLKCDSSGFAIGAVLCQQNNGKEHVIAYASQALSPTQCKWATGDREAYSLVWSVKKFHNFLDGIKFKIITDHHALCYLFKNKDTRSKLCRWKVQLQQYDFTIEYKSAKCNVVADCLSRYGYNFPVEHSLSFVSVDKLKGEQQNDIQNGIVRLNKKIKYNNKQILTYNKGNPKYPHTQLIYVPHSLRYSLLNTFHNDSLSGHVGKHKLWENLRYKFFWSNMHNDITSFIKSCVICQMRNVPSTKPQGLLQPIVTSKIFDTIALDFVSGFGKSLHNSNTHILVCVDLFSKYVIAKATKNASSDTVVNFLINDVFLKYGFPNRILSDRGQCFLSNTVTDLLRTLEIKKVNTTAYHPQCDGMAEATVKNITNLLGKLAYHEPRNWDSYLNYASYIINTTYNASIKTSPYKVLHGFEPRNFNFDHINNNFIQTSPSEHVEYGFGPIRNFITKNLAEAQVKQKVQYDKHHRDVSYNIGDMVLIKNSGIRPASSKLLPRYTGPYKIISQVNPVTYRILLDSSNRCDTFHVSKFKPFIEPMPFLDTSNPSVQDFNVKTAVNSNDDEDSDDAVSIIFTPQDEFEDNNLSEEFFNSLFFPNEDFTIDQLIDTALDSTNNPDVDNVNTPVQRVNNLSHVSPISDISNVSSNLLNFVSSSSLSDTDLDTSATRINRRDIIMQQRIDRALVRRESYLLRSKRVETSSDSDEVFINSKYNLN